MKLIGGILLCILTGTLLINAEIADTLNEKHSITTEEDKIAGKAREKMSQDYTWVLYKLWKSDRAEQ